MKFGASAFDAMMYPLEVAGLAQIRRILAGRASGSLLEIGPGSGANLGPLARYASISSYTGIDPAPPAELYHRCRILEGIAASGIHIVESPAESMPFPAESFDTVLVTLVLCSVRSQAQVLQEIRRVMKPDARLLFMEHVVHPRPGYAALMHVLDHPYHAISRECHMDRDTVHAMAVAGFAFREIHRRGAGVLVWGEARLERV